MNEKSIEDEEQQVFDKKRALEASRGIDRLRNSGVFKGDKSSVEIIRELRDKRVKHLLSI